MNRYPLWKYVLIAAALLFGFLYTLPNFFGESPAVQVSPVRAAVKTDTAELLRRVEEALKEGKIAQLGAFAEPGGVKVRFADTDAQSKARDLLNKYLLK